MTPAHLRAVTTFLGRIAQATGMPDGVDPSERIATMAVMLGEKHADTRMFSDAAASAVAVDCGVMNMPSVGIISKLLEKWWDKNKPAIALIQAPGFADLEGADLSPEDRMNVRIWMEHFDADDLSKEEMIVRLGVIRRYAHKGYRWMIAQHTDAAMLAADIAVRQQWVDDEIRWKPPTMGEREAVAEIVRRRYPTAQQREDLMADEGIAKNTIEQHAQAALREINEGRQPWWRDDDC